MRLTRLAYDLLARDWRLIIGITAVYGLLNVVLVRGLNGGVDIAELKTEFSQLQNGVVGSLGVMASLITSSNTSASDAARAYQSFLIVTTSLALVWCFRQLLLDSAKKLRIRDGFYKGMYPLIPVMVVLLHVGLRLIPMAFGGFLFILVVSTGIAVGTAELYFWSFLFFLTVLWSLLLLIPALFALYIASLPGMTPLRALRSAKKLVRFRRLTVLRKVLFLPVLILIPLSVVLLGAIAIVPVLAQWIYFVLSMLMLPIIHAYMYSLYRELLDE